MMISALARISSKANDMNALLKSLPNWVTRPKVGKLVNIKK